MAEDPNLQIRRVYCKIEYRHKKAATGKKKYEQHLLDTIKRLEISNAQLSEELKEVRRLVGHRSALSESQNSSDLDEFSSTSSSSGFSSEEDERVFALYAQQLHWPMASPCTVDMNFSKSLGSPCEAFDCPENKVKESGYDQLPALEKIQKASKHDCESAVLVIPLPQDLLLTLMNLLILMNFLSTSIFVGWMATISNGYLSVCKNLSRYDSCHENLNAAVAMVDLSALSCDGFKSRKLGSNEYLPSEYYVYEKLHSKPWKKKECILFNNFAP